MKEKNERKKRRGKRNGAIICYFILYVYTSISIYLSFRSYIFNKKLYRIYNRHCLLHFLYPNFYCTFPHGESLFCSSSFSLLFLILSSSPFLFFTMVQIFCFFVSKMIDTGKTREKVVYDRTQRALMSEEEWIPFRDRSLDKRKFSKHRDIFFYRGSMIRFVRKIEFVSLINWLTLLNLFIY